VAELERAIAGTQSTWGQLRRWHAPSGLSLGASQCAWGSGPSSSPPPPRGAFIRSLCRRSSQTDAPGTPQQRPGAREQATVAAQQGPSARDKGAVAAEQREQNVTASTRGLTHPGAGAGAGSPGLRASTLSCSSPASSPTATSVRRSWCTEYSTVQYRTVQYSTVQHSAV